MRTWWNATVTVSLRCLVLAGLFGACSLFTCRLGAQDTNADDRPPAVPLIAHDPYFSVWSMADRLTDSDTRHWTGTDQPLAGLIRIDGANYRFMGVNPRSVPPMPQVARRVTPLHTVYAFAAAGVQLEVRFFTAALPQDLEILSRPVDYLTWNITATDGRTHTVDLLLDVSPRIAVNTDDEDGDLGPGHTARHERATGGLERPARAEPCG